MIDPQHHHGSNTNPRLPLQHRAVPLKVVDPSVFPWVVQSDNRILLGIPTRQVRSLVGIAIQTAPGQVRFYRGTAMLLGDDVIDLKRIERMVSRELAVFADTVCPIPNELTQTFIHDRVTGNQVRFDT